MRQAYADDEMDEKIGSYAWAVPINTPENLSSLTLVAGSKTENMAFNLHRGYIGTSGTDAPISFFADDALPGEWVLCSETSRSVTGFPAASEIYTLGLWVRYS